MKNPVSWGITLRLAGKGKSTIHFELPVNITRIQEKNTHMNIIKMQQLDGDECLHLSLIPILQLGLKIVLGTYDAKQEPEAEIWGERGYWING